MLTAVLWFFKQNLRRSYVVSPLGHSLGSECVGSHEKSCECTRYIQLIIIQQNIGWNLVGLALFFDKRRPWSRSCLVFDLHREYRLLYAKWNQKLSPSVSVDVTGNSPYDVVAVFHRVPHVPLAFNHDEGKADIWFPATWHKKNTTAGWYLATWCWYRKVTGRNSKTLDMFSVTRDCRR